MATKPNPARSRLFYSISSLILLVLTFLGFKLFYLQAQAYPGRPLTPPIRTLLITHGVSMTAWMLLAVLQPLLVAGGNKRLHMRLGMAATLLAAGIVVVGYLTAIHATRLNPPDLILFGLNPRQFLTVPLMGVVTFAMFVSIGIWKRCRPEIHRPVMFMASMSVIAAAMGRMPALNTWYAGTWLEHWLSAFVTTVILGGVLLAVKCLLERRLDRWFAGAYGLLAFICVVTSLVARTEPWMQFATMLTR